MSFEDDFQNLKIPLKDVMEATGNFDNKPIGTGGFGKVYKGVLQGTEVAFKCLDPEHGQGDTEFWTEIKMLSKYKHENLVSLLHFCNEDAERILVYEYASNGSLDRHLGDPTLSWTRRLQICLGAARGLKYLHYPNIGQQRVLHRDIKSANILLDDKFNAKVSDFGLSKIGPANQSCTYLFSNAVGTPGYCDPLYSQTSILSKESDVYSFGVVLFEVMCGKLCYKYHNDAIIILVHHWKECYDKNKLTNIIYHDLKKRKDRESLKTFSAIANRCLNLQRGSRPTMVEIVKELELALQQENSCQDNPDVVETPTSYKSNKKFDDLKIPLEQILSATNNFDDRLIIGRGGFGTVYCGEIFHSKGQSKAAFKRLDSRFGQGDNEFLKEITMHLEYNHKHLVSLLCLCDDDDERILGYEYASNGSLDRHLSNPNLTWTQRLKICIGVASALNYLHDDPTETRQRVVHRDIKSTEILLDENWTAKVSDFGLSVNIPINQQHTYLECDVFGTPGYCDPLYMEKGLLSTKSDVYSFGVVLFEVMCGRLCYEFSIGNHAFLVSKWKQSYDEKRLDEIILPGLKEQMEPSSLNTFSAIAYQCLKNSPQKRPAMAKIVIELEIALAQQELFEELRRIVDLVVPTSSFTSQSQLSLLLLNGTLVGDGKTWLSINNNRETYEMIAAIKCMSGDLLLHDTTENSRFSNVISGLMHNGFRVEVRTQFLLPRITYTINLIFKHSGTNQGAHVPFKFKFHPHKHYSNLSIGHVREDGWMMVELCRFTSFKQKHEFKIDFLPVFDISFSNIQYFLEGIEFRPLEYVI